MRLAVLLFLFSLIAQTTCFAASVFKVSKGEDYLYVGGTAHTDLRAVFVEHSPISYVTGIPVSPGDFIHCGSNAIVFSGYYTH